MGIGKIIHLLNQYTDEKDYNQLQENAFLLQFLFIFSSMSPFVRNCQEKQHLSASNLDFHNHLFWQPWALIVILSVIVGNCWCHFWTAPNTNFISTYKFCCWYAFIRQTVGDDWCGWRLAQDWREMEEGGHTIGDNSPQCQYLILAILASFCFIGLEWLFKKFNSKHTVSRQIHHLT